MAHRGNEEAEGDPPLPERASIYRRKGVHLCGRPSTAFRASIYAGVHLQESGRPSTGAGVHVQDTVNGWGAPRR